MPAFAFAMVLAVLTALGAQPKAPESMRMDPPRIGQPAAHTPEREGQPPAPINVAIGDVSWAHLHGALPGPDAVDRIPVHLRYVADRLAAADVAHLSPEQQARRSRAIVQLRAYTARGIFPRRAAGDGYGPRRPRFIDDRGVHCAVGELIRASGHAELARAIDRRWSMAHVGEMRSDALLDWARAHGFTVDELAMIQPSYRPPLLAHNAEMALMRLLDPATVHCAAHGPVPPVLTFLLRNGGRRVEVGLTGRPTPFNRCLLSSLSRHGNLSYRTYSVDLMPSARRRRPPADRRFTVPLESPREIVLDALREAKLEPAHNACWSDGPMQVRQVAVRVVGGGELPLRVEARTTPPSEGAEACFARRVGAALEYLKPLEDNRRSLRKGGDPSVAVLDMTVEYRADEAGKPAPSTSPGQPVGP